MSNYPQYLLASPIAAEASSDLRMIPPVTAQEAGTGRISQQAGWGQWNMRPIGEGGIPPFMQDFNGTFYLLSQLLFWYQQGGIMQYASTLAYEPGNEVFSGGVKYRCLIANGPGTDKGVVAPASDKTVWSNQDLPSVLAGQVTPFYNCKLGGSDGRRLIPWGSSDAYEAYVLCDGGSDGMGGNVPNLMDKFLLPGTVAQAGQTGGSLSLTIPGVNVNGTVGETVLTVDQIPAHTHTGSTSTAGSHTHTRGTQNIRGAFSAYQLYDGGSQGSGALYDGTDEYSSMSRWGGPEGHNGSNRIIAFDASRSWSGSSSSSGSHSHTITMDETGGGKGHTHTITSSSEDQQITLDRPPFFRLAYFVKLPE